MRNLITILLILYSTHGFSQKKLVKDIDFDGKKDTVYTDLKTAEIVRRLSTQNFKKISTKVFEVSNDNAHVESTKNGFEYRCNWMRTGYANQFRYNKTLKKVQLIGMSRYAFGNAANDGSGKSSVNLLTGDYIGDWNYFDENKRKLIKIPTIKTKMAFPKVFLENFSEETYFSFADKCSKLYEKGKLQMQKRTN
ncbi:MAG: hypothetical protein EOO96_23395 [Pedobacter sp.]|nr:MAG: hypothetical protein EOO96_23395 [Pedobacter sp.]